MVSHELKMGRDCVSVAYFVSTVNHYKGGHLYAVIYLLIMASAADMGLCVYIRTYSLLYMLLRTSFSQMTRLVPSVSMQGISHFVHK